MSTIRRWVIGLSKFWLGLRGLLDDTALIRNGLRWQGRVDLELLSEGRCL
jgi:hypothetical protein